MVVCKHSNFAGRGMISSETESEIRRPQLSDQLADQLGARILAEEFAPGERLPTGVGLARSFGVSRTVVREALSRLKAEGLIETRQGAGAFVCADPHQRPFRLPGKPRSTVKAVQHVLELRRGVEAEAAALAACNRNVGQLAQIRLHFEMMGRCETDADGLQHDQEFHRAIAVASGNPLFPQFLDFLFQHAAPAIRMVRQHPTEWALYASLAQSEHTPIVAAIAAREAEQARAAMRHHLTNGMHRIATAIP